MTSSPTQATFNTYTADGTTTVFPYSFLLLSNNDLEVSIDGMTQARNVDYQITGTTNPDGGNVTFCTTPANASRILLSRRLTLKRLSVSVDHDFDRIWQALQQLQDSSGESVSDHVQAPDPHPQYLTARSPGAGGLTTRVALTQSGTFTVPAGVSRLRVTVAGAGGGGGGTYGTDTEDQGGGWWS